MASINETLRKMREAGKIQDYKVKGTLGEDAVFDICSARNEDFFLYHSVLYPYQSTRAGKIYTGNIKYEDGQFKEYTDKSIDDEIDVLYITKFRIFVIEVKAYHARNIDIYDHWVNKNGSPMEKSPVTQAEKHARHLYHVLYDVIPDGNPDYIIPMCCFVDNCTLRDDRSEYFINYIPCCVLNNLNEIISYYNIPMEYNINLEEVNRKLKNVAVSIKKQAQ